ncbi:IPT/TIG domain-containing protein [Roseateles sp. YR242]|uniref:IPT/TIG domain-containing protein n=1 Tax=Roseateles sp. YR242 TaxID=1855305 RepID=UPI0015A5E723|nr:IPT/TIG domain-containing protein [Roseateles sp. YR242]
MMSLARLRAWLALLPGALVVLVMLCAPLAQAQTAVSGAVSANTRWSVSGSPYVVSGDVSVQGGALLTIDAGVTVYMAAGARLTVAAGGVQAIGTAEQPIQVLSDKRRQGAAAAPGDWDQWVFTSGTVNTRLERVTFMHGKGLRVEGSAPVFNYLDIQHQQGPAIAVDLAASPSGVGNRASSNVINGIAVPAGDVVGTVKWALRGIPYVVSAGSVSVGASPTLSGVSPATLEQGQTVTVTVNGTRLGGLSRIASSNAGLTFTPFSGGSSSQIFAQIAVSATAPVGQADLQVLVDAGALSLLNAFTITPPMPAISGLSPSTVLAGAGVTDITVTGRNFTSTSVVLFNDAQVPTTFVSATQLKAALPNQSAAGTLEARVRTPVAATPNQPLLSNTATLTVQVPVPPVVAVEPTPIALPPDGKSRDITIRLSKADYRDNILNFSVSDTSKATVTPATVVVPAGQTTATVTIVPKLAGTVSFIVDSPTLQRIAVPLFITNDFTGVSTAYAPAVGVLVNAPLPGNVYDVTVANATVGVAVGSVLTQVEPRAWSMGGALTLSIKGAALPAGAQVSLTPATGITLGAPVLNAQATELRVPVTTATDAALGARKLTVRDAAGKELVFADPAQSVVQVMTGLPVIQSATPIIGARGETLKMVIRGRHLQRGLVRLSPQAGIRVDAAPTISADGTELTAYVEVAADAPTGERLVQVETPTGSTTATISEVNRFTVVARTLGDTGPISAPLVGVMVGKVEVREDVQPASSLVGVLVGTGVSSVSPNTGVIGSSVTVSVRGSGLQGVTSLSLSPSTGLTVGAPTVNETGSQLSFTVTVDAGAVLGTRRLTLNGSNGLPVTFSRPTDGSFLISAPVPELIATEPQVLVSDGSMVRMTLRGRNLINVTGARIEPSEGVAVTGPFESSEDGTVLSFSVTVAAGAASGERAVVVTSAAGESTSTVLPGNIVRIAQRTGGSYAAILSAPVGVRVGAGVDTSITYVDLINAVSVGVQVGGPPPAEPDERHAASPIVGVVLGMAGQSVSPDGWLQGSAGDIVVTGQGLDAVTTVVVEPATGLLLGTPVASNGGTRLAIPVSVAPDAPLVLRRLRLSTAAGTPVNFPSPTAANFGIGVMPSITSLSPIVYEQGKSATMAVRGTRLQGVTGVQFELGSGLRAGSDLLWSQDALGELLTIPVMVDRGAALGKRVVRLVVPGGLTPAEASSANTITVVTPQ